MAKSDQYNLISSAQAIAANQIELLYIVLNQLQENDIPDPKGRISELINLTQDVLNHLNDEMDTICPNNRVEF